MPSIYSILLLALGAVTNAATVTYDFNITWVTANPDGLQPRPVMGINGQWPIPGIKADVGDRVVVNVQNQLGNATTSLHFHGIYQNGSTHMDGAVGATQCPIGIGDSFTYDFKVDQPGTYWYHSHELAQYPDGLRGPLIINDPESPYKDQYHEERVLTLSDWYHEQMSDMLKGFISVTNPTGAEPVPVSALLNDTQNLTTSVEPGKTYMFRIVNMAALAGQYVWFEGHTMQIVEVDGIYTKPAEAEVIYLTAGQRYSVLITTKNETSTNFPFMASMDQDLFDTIPNGLNPNVTGWLVYNAGGDLPAAAMLDAFDEFDDFTLVPEDEQPLMPEPGQTISLTMKMDNLGDGANYAFFNDITYVRPKVPTIFTALSTGPTANNVDIYGTNSNAFVLEKGEIVDIILNNADPGKHPFHLHGHAFQTIVRSEEEAGEYVANETFPAIPMKRDTVMWHVATGLVATLIESPLEMQKTLTIPQDHIDACTKHDILIAGNAAGNTEDLLDLKGAAVSPAPLPEGFTPRGIVALVFSILSAFLGVGIIAWYGAGEVGTKVPGRKTGEAVRGVEEGDK